MKKLLLIFTICTLTGHFSFAQQAKEWALQTCIDFAFRNNLNLKNAENQTFINGNTLTQSQMNYLPSVSAGASLSQSAGGRSFDPYTNSAVQGVTYRNSNLNLSGSWNLFNGLQVHHNIASNKSGLKASQLDVATQRNTITLNIINSYVAILNGYEQVANAEKQLALTVEQLNRTQKLVDAGSSAEVAVLNLKAQKSSDELNVISFQNSLDIAKMQLQQLMQMPVEEGFNVVKPNINAATFAAYPKSSNDVYQAALGTQPQIKAADERIVQSIQNVSLAKSAYSPSLNFSGGYFTSYSNTGSKYTLDGTYSTLQSFQYYSKDAAGNNLPVYQVVPNGKVEKLSISNQFDDNLRSSLSLNLSVPIFNQWQTRSSVANAKIRKHIAENSAQLERNTLRQNIEQSWLDARLADRKYQSNVIQVSSLREAFRANEARFNVGAINSIEYNTSKTSLVRAESDLIRAKYDLLLKTKILEFYEGKQVSF